MQNNYPNTFQKMIKLIFKLLFILTRYCKYKISIIRGYILFGKYVSVSKFLKLENHENVFVKEGCSIDSNCVFKISGNGKIIFGKNCKISHNVTIIANDSIIEFGDNCFVGEFTQIAGYIKNNILIGNDVLIAPFNFIISSNHGISRDNIIRKQNGSGQPISIGNDNWLGVRTTILPGSKLPDGAVLSANTTFTKNENSTKKYCIYKTTFKINTSHRKS